MTLFNEDEPIRVSTVAEVQAVLLQIPLLEDDHSRHQAEDELHVAVLRAIAEGTAVDGASMARLAITSEQIEFHRWYS